MITHTHWEKAISYQTYRDMIDALIAEGKTTGKNQSPELLNYTQMNVRRMSRWDKTAVMVEPLQEVLRAAEPQKWLVLTEGWCGDAAQNIPMLVKMAAMNPHIEIRFLLRDENLEVMDAYLTNGGRSIPKLIALKETPEGTLEEFFNWGPRPIPAQEMIIALKKENTPFEILAEKLHKWYADDKQEHLQAEFFALLQ